MHWRRGFKNLMFAVTVPLAIPQQTGNSGKFLGTDGTVMSWNSVVTAPAGSSSEIQYNNAGAFGATPTFVWDNTNKKVTIIYAGVGTSQKSSILLTNSTAATSGNQQNSPGVQWQGQGWKTTATAASQSVEWFADVLPLQGTTAPYSRWRLRSSVNGGSLADMFSIDSIASTSVTYPKMNVTGRIDQSINIQSPTAAYTITNSDTSSGSTAMNYVFGSNLKHSDTINAGGKRTFTNAGNNSFDFYMSSGSTTASPSIKMQIDQYGYLNFGRGINVGMVTANSSNTAFPTKLTVNGGIGLKSETITSNTTLSSTDLTAGVIFCDSSNAALCTGTPATDCSGYSYGACSSHTTIGCTANLGGNCGTNGSSTDESTCESLDASCNWETTACSPYNNDQSGCAAAGFPSGSQCSWNAESCSYYGADEATCVAAGCSTSNSGDCSAFNGNGATCTTYNGCTYNDPDCTGNYYVPTGDCVGAPTVGTCSGTYATGTCTGGDFGTCTGSALCSNLTASGSGVCNSYSGCAWSADVTIKLPSLAASYTVVSAIAPWLNFKKVNSGAGACKIQRADSTTDTIEGSTSVSLSAQYDKVIVYPRYLTATCSVYNDDQTSCEAQTGCTWPSCDDYDLNESGCYSTNGCTWDAPGCSGTVTPSGTCSGDYSVDNKWYKF